MKAFGDAAPTSGRDDDSVLKTKTDRSEQLNVLWVIYGLRVDCGGHDRVAYRISSFASALGANVYATGLHFGGDDIHLVEHVGVVPLESGRRPTFFDEGFETDRKVVAATPGGCAVGAQEGPSCRVCDHPNKLVGLFLEEGGGVTGHVFTRV